MLRAGRRRRGWRAISRVLLISSMLLTGAAVTDADVSLVAKIQGAAHAAAKFVLQQSSTQQQQRLPGQTAAKKASVQGIVRDASGRAISRPKSP